MQKLQKFNPVGRIIFFFRGQIGAYPHMLEAFALPLRLCMYLLVSKCIMSPLCLTVMLANSFNDF